MVASFSTFPLIRINPILHKIKLFYVVICMMVGIYAGLGGSTLQGSRLIPDIILWGCIGLAIGCLGLWIENQLKVCRSSTLIGIIGGSLGLMAGLVGSGLLNPGTGVEIRQLSTFISWIRLPVFLLCPYIGMVVGIQILKILSTPSEKEFPKDFSPHRPSPASPVSQKLLDSSAIIDGRILPLCTTGFLEGPLVVPQSILHELQALADSGHLSKRIKGKRGLEILSQLQQLPNVEVRVSEDWEPAISAVDHQLIAIAKIRKAKIVTNDWNLAKIAILQGVLSLNVNDLTYQLRPLVLPGDTIRVFIHKEGQGHGQGIAHLDDGTMVVVDHGATLVGQAIEVVVTRFMQTTTGRMIFSSPHGDHSQFLLNSVS